MDSKGRLLPIYEWEPHRDGFNAAREQISSSMTARFGNPKPPFQWSSH